MFFPFSTQVRKCNTLQLLSDAGECPTTTICTESEQSSKDGVCLCKNETLTFNPQYTNDTDYCIYIESKGTKSSTKQNDNSNNHSNNRNIIDNKTTMHTDDGNKQQISPLPGAKHVAAGILIPILCVFIVVIILIIVKKFHIAQHVRNFRRNRRTRPFYGDVSLGMNDNDDPPLI